MARPRKVWPSLCCIVCDIKLLYRQSLFPKQAAGRVYVDLFDLPQLLHGSSLFLRGDLKTRYGTERPFTVPDAYFDRVEEEVMRSVAADAAPPVVRVVRKSLWKQLSPLVAAACVVGVIVLVGLGVSSTNPQGDMAATVSHAPKVSKAEPYTDDLDRLADYTMMDEDDAYAYISGE